MTRSVLILTEERGAGGIHTVTGLLQSALAAQGWSVQMQSVRHQRPGFLTLLNLARQASLVIASNNFLPAYWAVLLGLLAQRPTVVWVHGPLSEVLDARPVPRWRRWLLNWTCRMADALVFASHTSQASLLRLMPARQLQVVIHNPAPPVTASPPSLAAQNKMLGFVGRLSAEKRPQLLLQALALLGPEFELMLVGDGPLRHELEQLADTLALRGRVHFVGEQAVGPDTYRHWQATLLCSAYEGYPMAALESLAAGVPVLGTALPALQEILQTQATCWLASSDSPQALARKVQSVLQMAPETRRQQALAIAERHPADAFAKAWQDLLLRLLGERAPGPRTVHFVHTGPAYMPELSAYEAHLSALGHSSQRHSTPASVPIQADVVWWICGRVSATHAQRLRHSLQVHEYASASVGRWPAIKDSIKRWQHPRPQHRVFLNDWVRERMGFDDGVTYSLRDMGVPAYFLQAQASAPVDHDLVYLGEMSRLRAFVPALQAISKSGLTLLLIGQLPGDLADTVKALPGIRCTGRMAQRDVPAQLLRARAGLNLMPNQLPLAMQTSTKVLEYLAVGLPILSNDYPWIRQMAAQYPQRIELLSSLQTPEVWTKALQAAASHMSDRSGMQHLAWSNQLSTLAVWQQLGLQEASR